jgi:hypothetical protein
LADGSADWTISAVYLVLFSAMARSNTAHMRFLRQVELRSGRSTSGPSAPTLPAGASLTLRVATPEDLPRIARLAALDSSWPPAPPVLTATLDGEICVAVSLTDLHTVADPFRFTTEVRAITLARADQLRSAASPERRGRLRLRLRTRQRSADRSPRPQSAT